MIKWSNRFQFQSFVFGRAAATEKIINSFWLWTADFCLTIAVFISGKARCEKEKERCDALRTLERRLKEGEEEDGD